MLRPRRLWDIPEETARIAKASFPRGNRYLTLRDEVGVIYQDEAFEALFVWRGQPAESPGLLAMVTVMQFAEGLTDRQAAEAVGGRIDWKYVLGLEITAPALAHSVLNEFRQRLIAGSQEQQLLELLLVRLKAGGWLKARGRQRTDSTHVLAAIRQLNRLEGVGESMRRVLNDLAQLAPDWLLSQISADWFDRYGPRFETYRLPTQPAERAALQLQIGQDGLALLTALYQPQSPAWLREVPTVQLLRQLWLQQYYQQGEQLYWRTDQAYGLPPQAVMIQSPADPQARNRTKRSTNWTGYVVHLTESCDPDQPNLITDCQTTPATTADVALTDTIHQALADKGLLPAEHLVDTGYVDAGHLVKSRTDYQLDLIGPVPPNPSWQAKAQQAYDLTCFAIDWSNQTVTCPQGKQNSSWRLKLTPQSSPMIEVKFRRPDCLACEQRARCTKSQTEPRLLNFHPQAQHQALQAARQRQQTQAFKVQYQQRAGIEGSLSQGVRAFGLRQSRYIGLAKTHLQHLATAAAMNLTRLAAWLEQVPKAHTRLSHFMSLKPACST
jgi:transposase